jgi:hypothetical protein
LARLAKTNIFFQIFEEIVAWIREYTRSLDHLHAAEKTIMRLNWLMAGQKAGFDESKLRRDGVRVHTGKEFLDQLDQCSRLKFGKLNLRTPCNLVDMY